MSEVVPRTGPANLRDGSAPARLQDEREPVPDRRAGQERSPTTYDAFVSYTQVEDRDVALARSLKRGLERMGKPWFRRRALRIFLDEAGIGAEGGLAASIRSALGRSRHLILIASPVAAERPWVIEECRVWVGELGRPPPMILLSSGRLSWDATKSDVAWERTDALPASLRGRWIGEPFVVDGRGFDAATSDLRNPEFAVAVAKLAAPLHGMEPGDLVGRDVREHRRTRSVASVAVALILSLASAAAWWAFAERTARREAELRLADGRVFEGGVNLERGDPASAEQALLAALDGYRALGASDLPASFGLLRTHLKARWPLLRWHAHQGRAYAVALTRDGGSVISAGEDGAVRRTFIAEPGRTVTLQPPGPSPVRALAMAADGVTAAAGLRDGRLLLWRDLDGRPETFRFPGLASIEAVALNASYAFAGSSDGYVYAWPLHGGQPYRIQAHSNRVTSLNASNDTGDLLSGSIDNSAALWRLGDAQQATLPPRLPYPGPVQAVALGPAPSEAVVGGADGLVHFWNLDARKERIGPVHHGDPVFAIALDDQGQFGVSGDSGGRMLLWDQATGTLVATLVSGGEVVFGASMTPDGDLVAAGDARGDVRLWASSTPARRPIAPGRARPLSLAISEDGLLAAGGNADGRVEVWDTVTGDAVREFRVHRTAIRFVSVSTATGDMISAAEDGSVARTDLRSGADLWRSVAPARVTAIGRDGDGRAVLGLSDGSLMRELPEADATPASGLPVVGVIAVTSGQLVSVDSGGAIRRGSRSLAPPDHAAGRPRVTAFATAENLSTILGREDGSLEIVTERSERVELPGEGSRIVAIRQAADGRTALVLSERFDLTLWSLQERRPLSTLHLSVHPGFNSRVSEGVFASAAPSLAVFAGDAAPELVDLSAACKLSGRGSEGEATLDDVGRLALNRQWRAAAARSGAPRATDAWLLRTAPTAGKRVSDLPPRGVPKVYSDLVTREGAPRP